MNTLRRFLIVLLAAFIPLAVAAAQTIFTTSAVIANGDPTYDGQDIWVVDCTLTVDGPHSFNSLELRANGVLTHPATTATSAHSLKLTIAGNLFIDTNSAIDVSGRGYPADYTIGGAVQGASTGFSGGSYGGFGAPNTGTANDVYGDYRNPNELGSGGADINAGGGGAGGGLIRITAASAQVDGKILANGQTPSQCGAGSGGGIYLNVGTLSGVGLIAANGGPGNGWNGTPGGGGRVAVYYNSATNFNLLANVTAHSGGGAGVGTVYLVQAGHAGLLLIASHGTSTGFWTPLGLSTDALLQADSLMVSGANVVAAPAHQMEVQAGSISVLNGAVLTHQAATLSQAYSLLLTVTNTLLVNTNSAINVSGRGYLPDHTLGGTNEGEPAGFCGGSYGGLGGANAGTPVPVYGDYHNPNELGSGGSDINSGGGGAGGGLLRITAANAQVDGKILANGQTPNRCGAGSGGGIYLDVGTLSGVGLIAANGGPGNGWNGTPGGGGRVAVYYTTATNFNLLTNVTAHSGGAAGVGTIFLQQTGGPAQLLITSPWDGSGSMDATGPGDQHGLHGGFSGGERRQRRGGAAQRCADPGRVPPTAGRGRNDAPGRHRHPDPLVAAQHQQQPLCGYQLRH